MSDSRIGFNEVVVAWWRFFWRFTVIQLPLLLGSGWVVNYLGKRGVDTSLLLKFLFVYASCVMILGPLLVFKLILGNKMGKSTMIIVPAAVKRKQPDNNAHPKISIMRVFWTMWTFFWRYAIIIFALCICIEAVKNFCGIKSNPFGPSKYAMYLSIPASFLVFILLMWRKEKRRKLDVIRINSAPQ